MFSVLVQKDVFMSQFIEQFPIVFESLNMGFLQTVKLFFVTLVGALPLGLIISFGSMSKFKPLSGLVKIIVWIFRGSPLMIQMLIIYYMPGLVFGTPIWGGGEDGRFTAAAVAFILNYACYFSEIYRGGIEGVPIGQLVKDTSLARIIALQEIIWAGQAFLKGSHGISGQIWPLFFTGVYYLLFCGILTLLFGKLEKKLDYFKV